MKATIRSILVAITVTLAGCGEPESEVLAYAVRDSAGIEIIENVRPSQEPGRRWQVDTIPILDISAADDSSLLRLSGPLVLSDGRVAFFNSGQCEIRFYGGDGELLDASGGCGEGPGEFDEYASVFSWLADSLLVVDRFNRVSVLGPDGGFGRIVQLPESSDMPRPLVRGVLENGTMVLSSGRDPGVRRTPGVVEGQLLIALLSRDSAISMLGIYPGTRWEYTDFGGRLGRTVLAFSGSTVITTGAARVFVGFPDRFEIRVHGGTGALRRVIRRTFDPVTVEQRDIDWLMQRRLDEFEGEDDRRLVRQAFRDLRHAPGMPAFGVPNWPGGAEGGPSMLVNAEDNLWVFAHYRPGEYRNDWTVFSPDGVWLGPVEMPQGFVPARIGPDYLIGVWTDSIGFQHVRQHRLTRTGR